MRSDTIKAATAAIVSIVIVGGGMMQIYLLLQSGIISGDAGLAILGPLIGAAAAYVFQRDAQVGTQRATERAMSLGANTAQPQATVTTSEGPPRTTTVTPFEPEGDE